ncbi:MAG: glycosyl hydrolase family 8 [Bacillota bacterium]
MKEFFKTKGAKALALVLVAAFIVSITLILPMDNTQAASTFPYNVAYPYGLGPVYTDQATFLQNEYNTWKQYLVTSSGAGGYLRVRRGSGDNYDTVSEGIGYGMLLAAYFNDRTTLDGLFKYYKIHLDPNLLMKWKIDQYGTAIGLDAASDADQDVAIALIMADKLWGSSGSINYSTEANTIINKLMETCVAPDFSFEPGDGWADKPAARNPSYFAPAWYRIFAQKTGDSRWLNVVDKSYEILANINAKNNNTGLTPDWCDIYGNKAYDLGYDYFYDAVRTPWRIGVDYSWYGDTRAKAQVDKIAAFFYGKVTTLTDKYSITGTALTSNHSPTAVSMAATSTMTGTDMTYAQSFYNETKKLYDPWGGPWDYFGNTLRLLSMIYMTGNFPNPYSLGSTTSPTPTPTNTPTPTPSPVAATPTPTPTTTPTPTPSSAGTGSLKVQFYNNDKSSTLNTLYLRFKLVNTGTTSFDLANVKMRYYFTADTSSTNNFVVDYAQAGTSNVTGTFTQISPAKTNADYYLEVGFKSGAGSLAAGSSTVVEARVHKSDWSNYSQTNDYSFNSTATSHVDWDKVTAYLSGVKHWGIEP